MFVRSWTWTSRKMAQNWIRTHCMTIYVIYFFTHAWDIIARTKINAFCQLSSKKLRVFISFRIKMGTLSTYKLWRRFESRLNCSQYQKVHFNRFKCRFCDECFNSPGNCRTLDEFWSSVILYLGYLLFVSLSPYYIVLKVTIYCTK